MSRVLLVVSEAVPAGAPPTSDAPRKDYFALAEALDATVLDRSEIERSPVARLIRRLGGRSAAMAWLAFRRQGGHSLVFTDGEGVAIPLALLLKLTRSRVAHVTVGHRLSAPKKRPFFRFLKAHSHMTRIVMHSRFQSDIARRELGIPADRLALVPYQVDTAFWRPQSVVEERLISSAGLEHRDYPTLFAAVKDLDVRVAVGAASYWSPSRNSAEGVEIPPNVEVGSYDYVRLRELYARSAVIVVPLVDADFQAGVTTILEAMAMGKAVVVTHALGQTDVIEDRRLVTRGAQPRPRPISLLRQIAEQAGIPVEPTGFYVPPGDPGELRRAIRYLLDHPAERARLGAAGRRTVERLLTVEHFATRMSGVIRRADASYQPLPALRVGTGFE